MVHAGLVHVKVHQRHFFASLGKDAREVGGHKTLAFLGVQGGDQHHIGPFFREQVLKVGAQGTERLGHCASAVGPASDGVVAHVLVKGDAGDDGGVHRLTQFRGGFNALEKHHARDAKGQGQQKTHRRVGQNRAALVGPHFAGVACALDQRGFRGDAGSGNDGGGLPLEQVHRELFVHPKLAFHREDVALGFGQAGKTGFEVADLRLQVDAAAFHCAHFVGEVGDDVASNVLGA